jgi:uncharacterized protein (TIGR02271 family)
MTMLQKDVLLQKRGQELYDRDGDKIGTIAEIYLDTQTGEPEWALVNTGLFGTKSSFVPLHEAEGGETLRVPYEKSQVKDAPSMDPDGELSPKDESALYAHYGLDYGESRSASGLPEGGSGAGVGASTGTESDTATGGDSSFAGAPPIGEDKSGPVTDNAMTRSEEELRVGKREQEAGRVRLKKYVVEDEVTETVPVLREEVRIEREPITDANAGAATDGPAISEEEHEVVLHEERAVVDKEAVPKERVRLDKDTHVEEEQVSGTVRKEQIDIDDESGSAR